MAETKYDLKQFARTYLDTGNLAQAARDAGYAPEEGGEDNARQCGHRLFKDPKVKEEIDLIVEEAIQSSVFLVPLATSAIEAYLRDTSDPKGRKSRADLGAKILQDFRAASVKQPMQLDLNDSQLIDELIAILGNDPQLIAEIAKRAASAAKTGSARPLDTQTDESGGVLEAVPETGAILLPRAKVPPKNVSSRKSDG